MGFFTSPEDLGNWVQNQESPDSAAMRILAVTGDKDQQNVVDACRQIFEDKDKENSQNVLFGVLNKYKIVNTREGNMKKKIIREAQMMRQDSVYGNMETRVCPKLPYSVGKRLISTYNCRHYCLDSIVLDDDPNRVYCAEALWRNHVMDKFSREFKNKDGKWVGGYINERFQVQQDDGGNQMELKNGERTRMPRPHQYSIERRMEEARGNKTYDLTASNKKMVKIASDSLEKKDEIYRIFDDILEMKESGLNDEDVLMKVSEHYGKTISAVAKIHKMAMDQVKRHDKVVYAFGKNSLNKSAYMELSDNSTMVSTGDVEVISLPDGNSINLKINTPVVSSNGSFQIVDGPDAGKQFKLKDKSDITKYFESLDDAKDGKIQEAAVEVGLND